MAQKLARGQAFFWWRWPRLNLFQPCCLFLPDNFTGDKCLRSDRNSVIKMTVIKRPTIMLVLSLAGLQLSAAPHKQQMIKPAFERSQIEHGKIEKPQTEKSLNERRVVRNSIENPNSRVASGRETAQLMKARVEYPAMEASYRNAGDGSEALFPHAQLHRRLGFRGNVTMRDYNTGPPIKQHHSRLRGHFLYRGKADREVSPD